MSGKGLGIHVTNEDFVDLDKELMPHLSSEAPHFRNVSNSHLPFAIPHCLTLSPLQEQELELMRALERIHELECELQKQRDDHRAQIAEIQSVINAHNIRALLSEVDELKSENGECKAKLQEEDRARILYQEKISNFEHQLKECQQRVEKLVIANSDLSLKNSSLSKQVRVLTNDNSKELLEQETKKRMEFEKKYQEENAARIREREKILAVRDLMKEAIESLKDENAKLVQTLEERDREIEGLRQEVVTAKKCGTTVKSPLFINNVPLSGLPQSPPIPIVDSLPAEYLNSEFSSVSQSLSQSMASATYIPPSDRFASRRHRQQRSNSKSPATSPRPTSPSQQNIFLSTKLSPTRILQCEGFPSAPVGSIAEITRTQTQESEHAVSTHVYKFSAPRSPTDIFAKSPSNSLDHTELRNKEGPSVLAVELEEEAKLQSLLAKHPPVSSIVVFPQKQPNRKPPPPPADKPNIHETLAKPPSLLAAIVSP